MATPKANNDSRLVKEVEAFREFAAEFKNESDRAAVILGAAQLDNYLRQLLDSYFVPATTGADELLDGDSPLSTFSSRINISYRLGLIAADFAKALHLVRKIRNSFAHDVSGVSLSRGPHQDRVRELVRRFRGNTFYDFLLEKEFQGSDNKGQEFRAAIALMSLRLQGACAKVKTLDMPEPWLLFTSKPKNEATGESASENSSSADHGE